MRKVKSPRLRSCGRSLCISILSEPETPFFDGGSNLEDACGILCLEAAWKEDGKAARVLHSVWAPWLVSTTVASIYLFCSLVSLYRKGSTLHIWIAALSSGLGTKWYKTLWMHYRKREEEHCGEWTLMLAGNSYAEIDKINPRLTLHSKSVNVILMRFFQFEALCRKTFSNTGLRLLALERLAWEAGPWPAPGNEASTGFPPLPCWWRRFTAQSLLQSDGRSTPVFLLGVLNFNNYQAEDASVASPPVKSLGARSLEGFPEQKLWTDTTSHWGNTLLSVPWQ